MLHYFDRFQVRCRNFWPTGRTTSRGSFSFSSALLLCNNTAECFKNVPELINYNHPLLWDWIGAAAMERVPHRSNKVSAWLNREKYGVHTAACFIKLPRLRRFRLPTAAAAAAAAWSWGIPTPNDGRMNSFLGRRCVEGLAGRSVPHHALG